MTTSHRREEILHRYRRHAQRFDAIASRRRNRSPLGLEAPPEPVAPVTARERQVLELLADGLANKEIAQKLIVSDETVKSYLRTLFPKLGARSRAHAVAIAFRRGYVTV